MITDGNMMSLQIGVKLVRALRDILHEDVSCVGISCHDCPLYMTADVLEDDATVYLKQGCAVDMITGICKKLPH